MLLCVLWILICFTAAKILSESLLLFARFGGLLLCSEELFGFGYLLVVLKRLYSCLPLLITVVCFLGFDSFDVLCEFLELGFHRFWFWYNALVSLLLYIYIYMYEQCADSIMFH